MKRLKGNKAITLISLIITIIILLILATVTIMSLNEGGIIGKAQKAKKDYEDAAEEEKGMLAKFEEIMSSLYGGSSSDGETSGGESSGDNSFGNNSGNVTPGETTITWTDNGDGTITSSNGKTVQIGDTFTNEEVLEATGGTQSSYTGTWTVIGMKNGKLQLVSTSNVKSSVYLGGFRDQEAIEALPNGDELERAIWSYKNAVNTLNTVAQTATGITSAESIKLEDIYDILGKENINKGTEYGKVYKYYYNTTNSKVYSKYQTGTDGNGNITWSTGTDTGETSQTFVNDSGSTVVIDSAGDEIILTYNSFTYTLTDEQKEKLGNLANMNYWLAYPCIGFYDSGSRLFFGVGCVNYGRVDRISLFGAPGNIDSGVGYRVFAIVYI